jgi:hypothetical protein
VSRRPLSRFLGVILALTGAFASPVSALAHGHAHRHEAAVHAAVEHTHADHSLGADDHHRTDASGAAADIPRVESPDGGAGEHPHPSVDAAVTTKAASWIVAMVAAHVMLPRARVMAVSPPQPEPPLQLRVEAAHAPPPHLRGPPAHLA